jgi:hypothetical protein
MACPDHSGAQKALEATNKFGQCVTTVAQSSAVEAMTKAREMVDAVSFSRAQRITEKHWRCLRKADRRKFPR